MVEEQRFQTLEELAADALSTSMATSKSIPLFARIFIPSMVLVNIGLFAAGHFSLGGTIKIAAQVGQQDLSLDSFYNFSIANTVVEMWNAGARGMAMLIAIFSGLWPYVKQLVSLTLWFAPPTPPRWLCSPPSILCQTAVHRYRGRSVLVHPQDVGEARRGFET